MENKENGQINGKQGLRALGYLAACYQEMWEFKEKKLLCYRG